MDKIKERVSVRSLKISKNTINSDKKRAKNKRKDKIIERQKNEKYSTISSQTVIKDLKISATRSMNCVRNTFDNLSNRLKISSKQEFVNKRCVDECDNYQPLGADKTPVRLYSPFGFETPSPRIDRTHLRRSCRRQMFFSPTAKIKDDVLYLNNGIKELNLISEGIENRFSPKNSNFNEMNVHSKQSLI